MLFSGASGCPQATALCGAAPCPDAEVAEYLFSLTAISNAKAFEPPRGGAKHRATLTLHHVLTPKWRHSFFVFINRVTFFFQEGFVHFDWQQKSPLGQ